jgi:hypothetical protein
MTTAVDQDALLGDIEELRPVGVVDESPLGRCAAVDQDTWWVLVEMHALLLEGPGALGEREWVAQLQDFAETLVGVHRKGERAFDAAWCARYPLARNPRHPGLH